MRHIVVFRISLATRSVSHPTIWFQLVQVIHARREAGASCQHRLSLAVSGSGGVREAPNWSSEVSIESLECQHVWLCGLTGSSLVNASEKRNTAEFFILTGAFQTMKDHYVDIYRTYNVFLD